MSGYLQRLVQTAAQPVQTVHPFAGSIYSSRSDKESRSFESEESVIAAPEPAASVGVTSQKQNVSAHNPRRRDTVPILEYHPIAPLSDATPLPTENEINDVASSQEQLVLTPHTENVQVNAERPPASVFPRTEFHPLLPQGAVPIEPRLTPAMFRTEARAADDSRRPGGVEQVSDDIQIHIGRIEVTAVQPLAPRAAKTPDPSPSLDAYLKRRTR